MRQRLSHFLRVFIELSCFYDPLGGFCIYSTNPMVVPGLYDFLSLNSYAKNAQPKTVKSTKLRARRASVMFALFGFLCLTLLIIWAVIALCLSAATAIAPAPVMAGSWQDSENLSLNWLTSGDGTANNPFRISTPQEFAGFASQTNLPTDNTVNDA